jgi:ABC-type transport system substrate-binding protein
VAALLAGQVDMIVDTPYADRPRIEQADGVKLVAAPPSWAHQLDLRIETEHGAVATTYPGFVPATTNKLIRQAISHALDRTLLAEVQGSATPSLVYLISIWPEVDREKYIGSEAADAWYDPELSKQLIIEAGFDPDNGNKPKLYFDASSFDQGGEKEVAEAVTAMLEEVGFEVELTLRDNPTYQEQILRPGNNRDIQMVTTAKGPAILLTQTSCSWEGVNYVCFEELDELNNQILQEVDPVKRAELWGQWWEFYLDEAFTVSMYEIGRFYGMNERLEWTPRADGWITPRDARLVD